MDLTGAPHRRWNPLSGEWVLVSPGRTDRPWDGELGRSRPESAMPYDPGCHLCPGNHRVSGEVNDNYESTFVFTNDFAALNPRRGQVGSTDGLLRVEAEAGTCRVICFSPRHDLTLARMSDTERLAVVDLWAAESEELGREWHWVQVFENRGEMMGASNSHPHGQIWAGDALPVEPAKEDRSQRRHLEDHGTRLLADYAKLESRGDRAVVESEHWLVVVPFWAVWPFETLLLPREPVRRLPDLSPTMRSDLAALLGELLRRYDNLFLHPFPYSMGWHGAPFKGATEHWQLHAHFYPPLLRSETIRKHMVGYELLAEPQRDLTAEEAAARLRAVPSRHYLDE